MTIAPTPDSPITPKPGRFASLARLWDWITKAHPSIKETGKRQQAQLAAALSLGVGILTFIGLISSAAVHGGYAVTEIFLSILTIVAFGTYFINRSRYFKFGSAILVIGFVAVGYGLAISNPERAGSSLFSILPIALIISSLLLPLWGLAALTGTNFLLIFILSKIIPGYAQAAVDAGIYLTLGILLIIAVAYRNSVERTRVAEITSAVTELQTIRASLEQRVEDRTRELTDTSKKMQNRASQLQTVSEVSRAIASVPDIDVLLPTIARLISERFSFYHVGIFLLDPSREFAVLRAANSEGGQNMLARGHQLRVGETGIVGFVTEHGRPRVALDVGADAVFFANPDLPNTHSEVALPLKIGERIIGAMDVQSTQPSAFSQEDVEALETLADQVSVAIENARLFSETRRALDEVQATHRQYLRQEWGRTTSQAHLGYQYSSQKVDKLAEPIDRPEVQSALESGDLIVQEEPAALAIPLKIRGEIIGILNVRAHSTSRKWSSDEINTIQAITERAVLALENARLLQGAQRRAAREFTISDIAAKIGASAQVDTILQTTVKELGRVFGDSEIVLQLGSEKMGEKK